MPHSLRAKLSGLRYKKIITDKEYERLKKGLDTVDNLEKIRTEIKEIIKLYEGSCDQELGTKWGFEGALEIINKHIEKEKEQ